MSLVRLPLAARAMARCGATFALALAIAVGMLPGARPARAAREDAEGVARAKQIHKQAIAHYKIGDFEAALGEFKSAYLLRPEPSLLFNAAQCHRQLGNVREAARLYRSYLHDSPAAPNRAEVEKLIVEMDAAVAPAAPGITAGPGITAAPTGRPADGSLSDDKRDGASAPVAARPASRTWLWVTLGVVAAAAIGGGVAAGVLVHGSSAPDSTIGVTGVHF